MTNVCSLSLSPRAVMKSIRKSGCVLLAQGWRLRSHFIPAHQMKRYKKTVLRERLIPGHEIWPKFGKRLTGYGICSKYSAEFGKRFTGYGISLLPRKRDSPTLSARCMIGKKVIFAIPIYSLSVYASIYLINPFIFAILKWTDTFVKLDVV